MKFSFKAVLSTGWHTFKNHWKFIILLGFATMVAQMIVRGAQQAVLDRSPLLALILWLASTVLAIIISLGWAKVLLGLVRHNHADWNTFKTQPKQWLMYIKASIWLAVYSLGYMIVAAIPFIILGVIGLSTDIYWLQVASMVAGVVAAVGVAVYMAVRYQFLAFSAIDTGIISSKELFTQTGNLTNNNWSQLFGFALVSILLVIIGVLCLVAGLIVVIPVIALAKAKIYDMLKSHHA